MNLQLVRAYAVLIGGLAIIGLFVNGHLFQIMNTDIALDLLRVLLAGYLVYVGFVSKAEHTVNAALSAVGVLYLGMGLLGLMSPTLFGLLPTGLTGFDIMFHLVAGGLAAAAGIAQEKRTTAHSH